MLCYRIDLTPDDNETLLVTCPELPEVTTYGSDRSEAERNAIRAIEEAIAGRMASDDDVPVARPERGTTFVRLPLLASLKVLLYGELRQAEVTRAELARRLGWHREQVDRLFRLDHASRLDQIEAAFRAIGRGIEVRVRDAA